MRVKLLLVCVILISTSSFAQKCEWKTIPDAFNSQCKTSFIYDVNRGAIQIRELPSKEERCWIVYSDRKKNRLKNKPNGNNLGTTLDYMEALYVKEVKNNYLHVYGVENEDEKGWIEAKYLLLSKFSLKTEDNAPVPRKAIILTSLDDMKSGSKEEMDQILAQKYYFHQPEPIPGTHIGKPQSFNIMFVMKEQDGSVLLANTDVLNDIGLNKSKVYGWMPKSNINKWNSRVALEPSRSIDAINEYAGRRLPGYKKLQTLKNCVQNDFCDKNGRVVDFKVEAIRANRMRKPILTPIDKNIREIVSIAKNSSELGQDQQDIFKAQLEKLDKKSQTTNIVFVVDATISMKPYFGSVANSINKVIQENDRLKQHALRFGLLVYRDYADNDDAYSVEPLVSESEKDKIQEKVRTTKCKSNDKDLAEAQYNGLIKGIEELNLDPEESNVVVLIGDCGNHNPDPRGYKLNDVVKIFREKNINLISYQVKYNIDDSYFTFNEDAQDYIINTAEKIIEDNAETKTKVKWDDIDNNTYKLNMKEGENDFENMFGRFIYASANKPMNPAYLEESIVETLTEYMESVNDNIKILRAKLSGTGGPQIDTEKPPEGLILHIMDKFNCSYEEAIDFLNKTEITTKAYVAMDYNGNGVNAHIPVVFLTENEKYTLTKSLRRLTSGDCVTFEERKECFRKNLIEVCKSILGPKTSTETIEKLTMQEVWKFVIGIDFGGNKELRTTKLKDINDIKKKNFKKFYTKFESKANDFCDHAYEHSDLFKSRRFSLFGSYFYWIPLDDLPGSE